MKYPKEYLDEIKTRLKVSTVVSKTVKLKKRGKEFVGLSPFKTEKTPSFTVNDEKEFYHCFSTSEHGNIFDFVMKTQNLRFGEAVKMLSNLAGMQPYMFSKQDEERENKWKLYKFDPFLKKGVSGELIYLAKFLLSSTILPPKPIIFPDILFIGKIILFLNLDIYFFLFSSK